MELGREDLTLLPLEGLGRGIVGGDGLAQLPGRGEAGPFQGAGVGVAWVAVERQLSESDFCVRVRLLQGPQTRSCVDQLLDGLCLFESARGRQCP